MIKIKPDFSKPLLINNTNATVTTAGWANPENALFGSIKPNKTNNDKNTKATASYLHLPHTKKNKRTNKSKVIIN